MIIRGGSLSLQVAGRQPTAAQVWLEGCVDGVHAVAGTMIACWPVEGADYIDGAVTRGAGRLGTGTENY